LCRIILATLHNLSVSGSPRECEEAKGLVAQLSSFEILFVLHLLDKILPLLNSLNTFLQSKSGDPVRICFCFLVDALMKMRTDDAFKNIYDKVVAATNANGVSVPLSDSSQAETLSDQRKHVLAYHLDCSDVMCKVIYRQSLDSDCHSLQRDI